MLTKWRTGFCGELNECEFQVLLEISAPKTTEKAKNYGMKVFIGK